MADRSDAPVAREYGVGFADGGPHPSLAVGRCLRTTAARSSLLRASIPLAIDLALEGIEAEEGAAERADESLAERIIEAIELLPDVDPAPFRF